MFPRKVILVCLGGLLAVLLTSCAVRTTTSRSSSGLKPRTPTARANPRPATAKPAPAKPPEQPKGPKGTATIQVSRDGSDILFNLTFRSPQGDFTPPRMEKEPTFEVVTADGKQVFNGKFEFG